MTSLYYHIVQVKGFIPLRILLTGNRLRYYALNPLIVSCTVHQCVAMVSTGRTASYQLWASGGNRQTQGN